MEKHVVLRMVLLDAQVCSSGTIDEALDWLRSRHPSGTENNWGKTDRPELAPVTCADNPNRTHYVFVC